MKGAPGFLPCLLCAALLPGGCAGGTKIPVPAASAAPIALADPEIFTLSNGLDVWLLHSDHVPLVAVSLIVRSGSSSDPAGKEGLLSLAMDMMDEGAGARSALDLADEIQFLGASLDLSTGKDYSSIDLQVLKRNFGSAFAIFTDVLLQPSFSDKEWERVKRLSLNSLKQRGEQPTTVARVVGDRLFYGDGHPYAHPEDGYYSTVENIGLDEIRRAHSALFRPRNSVLLITGDFEPAALQRDLEARFSGWKDAPVAALPGPASAAHSAQRLVVVDKPGAAQTVIRVYLPGIAYGHAARPHLVLASTIFGGTFTSRLNSNLREEKKITYGARSGLASRRIAGHLVASSSVESGATALGISEFFREFQEMAAGRLREGELKKAIATQRSGLVESLQTQEGLLGIYSTTAALARQPAQRRAFYSAMNAASGSDLEAVSKKLFGWPGALIVLVGDRASIATALEELEKNGRARGGEPLEGFLLPEPEYSSREGAPQGGGEDRGKQPGRRAHEEEPSR